MFHPIFSKSGKRPLLSPPPIMKKQAFATAVTEQYVGPNAQAAMVYGRYKENGYQVNPLAAQAGGTLITEKMSASEAFKTANADFNVVKVPSEYTTLTGERRVSDKSFTLFREDNGDEVGSGLGKGYTPVQNSSLIRLFDYLRENVEIDNILQMEGGRRIYVTAQVGIEGEITEGDTIRRYLHAFNSFDGSSSFGVFFTDVRLACANQISGMIRKSKVAAGAGQGMIMRHTRNVEQFAASLPAMINMQNHTFQQRLDTLKPLTTMQLTTEHARKVLEATYAADLARPIRDKDSGEKRARTLHDLKHIETIREHYSGNSGFDVERGTVWGFLQAITQFETHNAGRLKDDTASARARLESLWGGQGAARIHAATDACLALV